MEDDKGDYNNNSYNIFNVMVEYKANDKLRNGYINLNPDKPLYYGLMTSLSTKEVSYISYDTYSAHSNDTFKRAIYPLLLDLERRGKIKFNKERTSYSGTIKAPDGPSAIELVDY